MSGFARQEADDPPRRASGSPRGAGDPSRWAAAEEEPRQTAAEDASEVGGEVDDEQRPGGRGERHAALALQVRRQPREVEPPHRVGEHLAAAERRLGPASPVYPGIDGEPRR
jgi:hypothetical protein